VIPHQSWWSGPRADERFSYCNAVEAGSKLGKNGPTFLSGHLVASLEDLLERLTGTPSISPAKSLVGRKSAAKPGLDKLGSWIEGRLTKFIAGEEEGDGGSTTKHTPAAVAKGAASGPVGPFSHFTAISPAHSGPLSRNPSAADVPGMNGHLGVPGESMRTSPLQPLHGGSPHVGGHHLEPTDSTTSSYGDYMGHHGRESSYTSWSAMQEAPQEVEGDGFNGDAGYAEDNDNGDEGEGEFINPLAAPMFGVTQSHDYKPASSGARANLTVGGDDDDEDDLGFGNAALSRDRTPKPPASEDTGEADSHGATPSKAAAEATKAKAEASASASSGKGGLEPQKSSSWLKGWWGKKEGEGSGPIRAKLGEESSMVYDKELKRWVVKGVSGASASIVLPLLAVAATMWTGTDPPCRRKGRRVSRLRHHRLRGLRRPRHPAQQGRSKPPEQCPQRRHLPSSLEASAPRLRLPPVWVLVRAAPSARRLLPPDSPRLPMAVSDA
jgi:hypothetical protein